MSASPDTQIEGVRDGEVEHDILLQQVTEIENELDLLRLSDDLQDEVLDAGLAEYQ